MLVFRVESKKTGEGPYHSRLPGTPLFKGSTGPGLEQDQSLQAFFQKKSKKKENYKDYYFGFTDRNQVYSWFNEECLNFLRRNEFHIASYRVHPSWVAISSWQCIFKREKASLLEVYPL